MSEDFGIVFDFNGTLFLDSDINEWAWRKFIKEKFGRGVTDEEFKKYFHGVNNKDTLERYAARELSEDEVRDLAENGKEKLYREYIISHPERQVLTDGAEDFFEFLIRQGIPFTIATASGKGNLDFFFEIFSLDKWFDRESIVYDNGSIPSKPNPEIYERAFKNISVLPQDGLVFEDALSGIEAAKRAGVKDIIGVDPGSKNHLEENRDLTKVVEDFKDFKNLITLIRSQSIDLTH